MAYTTIDDPSEYFQTTTYTGTATSSGDTQAVTGVGFQPDWVWIKNRDGAYQHVLYDAVRGVNKELRSSQTNSEFVSGTNGYLTAFDSDGFTTTRGVNTGNHVNANGTAFVSWNWLAANGTTSNSNGSITSTVSANTTSGFSIVTWTGNGSDATIGHGLSSAPEMYVVKNRSDSADWRVGQTVAGNIMTGGNGYYMEWNATKASTNPGSAVTWGSTPTAPTASVFTVGSNNAHNGSSDDMLAYCFHSVKGYSRISSYTGNGNANGAFIYTGFKPAWVMMKRTDSTNDWFIFDSTRNTFNETDLRISANSTNAESDQTGSNPIDILSNGFKCRGNAAATNASGGTYIYMAFAESPFVTSTSIPNNAR
tara:strand:- start:1047 stop:2144 length:1098 start_codon:yes stop_codon:yes gene_type:complete